MPTKIRLQRRGKKAAPFYHLVVADSRAPRDGKFIEKLGIYNPLTHPATIEINFDRALYWVSIGAQKSDTAKAILSYKGVLYKNHLQGGVKKAALTQEQADAKFEQWLTDKQLGIEKQTKEIELEGKENLKKRLEAETKVREERDKVIAAKLKSEMKAQEAADTATETPEAEVKEEVKEEKKEESKAEVKEEVKEEKKEEPKAEVKEEAKEEKKEEPKAEVKEEVKEEKKEEPKAEVKGEVKEEKEEEPKAEVKEEVKEEKKEEPKAEVKEEVKEEKPKAEEDKKED